MKTFVRVVTLLLVMTAPGVVSAQLSGEPKRPLQYDPVGDMRYTFERGAPNETVRAAQQALREKGYYRGAVDGIQGPEVRAAIWNFQKTHALKRSGSLDRPTVGALGLAISSGTASTTESSPSASPSFSAVPAVSRSAPDRNEIQAP